MKKYKKPCGFHCVKIKNMSVRFGEQTVLEDVNLHVHCGELMAVIGRNGAGKSTLIKAILDEIVHTGQIEFRDTENGAMQKIRIGYVPQSLNLEKNAPMDVYDLMTSYRYRFPIFLKKKDIYEEIKEALREFEADYLIDQPVDKLSGGELQRVLLSLAVMDRPNLLLLDEPVSGIDKNGMDLFYEKMDYLRKNYDMSILLISHDLDYVAKYANRVVLLDKGVVAEGAPKEVYESEAFASVFGKTSYEYGKENDTLAFSHTPHARKARTKEEPYVAAYKKKETASDNGGKEKES